MSAPYEIVISPGAVWLAATGTTFPEVDAAPSGSWTKIGTAGNRDYDTGGVTVTHDQTTAAFTGAGGTYKRKPYTTDEGTTVGFSLVDFSVAQVALVMGNLSIATRAADSTHAGISTIEMIRGPKVHTYALLLRADSSADDSLAMQLQIPACYQSANVSAAFAKAPTMMALMFEAIEATVGVAAEWVFQTAPHT